MSGLAEFQSRQVFLVTGASSGIGAAVARLLNARGATVIGVGRNRGRLEAVRARADAPERFFIDVRDLTDDIAGLPGYVRALKDAHGPLAGLAHCAGVGAVRPFALWDDRAERALFDSDYFAPMALLRGVVDARNNVGGGTACVLVASAAARLADKGHTAYAGAKAALVASCRAVAKELAPRRVRVNTISPTAVDTPLLGPADGAYARAQAGRYPMGFGEPADVAALAAFLLSDAAKWITGQDYVVDCASF